MHFTPGGGQQDLSDTRQELPRVRRRLAVRCEAQHLRAHLHEARALRDPADDDAAEPDGRLPPPHVHVQHRQRQVNSAVLTHLRCFLLETLQQ